MPNTSIVLYQFGVDPFNARYEDAEGRPAFTLSLAAEAPNLVIRLARDVTWAQLHPAIMGPANAFFYFGPRNAAGYIVYGNNRVNVPMPYLTRQQREGSQSRYFTTQSGKVYKWRIASQQMECTDGRNTVATWEQGSPDEEVDARLTIKSHGLPIITEIVTTLILNRMARELNW
ncbi:hypothetical protein CYLTODRAFT_261770 [Cylindrobasidium torrendii FP15055 ss-10]|uniref:DUF6593 domain-containing protein n=1 Tax=Cylindrobasidium torrendii FP15055 ss-10 TaxID=1314674 RepID=A0A0D7BD20_9AGAR|nr:hypothetical protein CYLTODRAFT_261770 [Cylindrobasidium torrendii FP15055 ss-10]